MAMDMSRRSFLRGAQEHDVKEVIRPPGAHATAFLSLCQDCDACVDKCPENIIAMDPAGQPVVHFSESHCTFCGACAEACPTGALDLDQAKAWAWRAQIAPSCWSLNSISCRICQDACDHNAIAFRLLTGGRAEPSVAFDSCTGCGACSAVCPADAVAFVQRQDLQKEHVA